MAPYHLHLNGGTIVLPRPAVLHDALPVKGSKAAAHGLRTPTASDHARAARQVAHLADRPQPASPPRLAAVVCGLDILAENIEDAAHNTTRFSIMSREASMPDRGDGKGWVTAFVFRVRQVPSALYKACL